MSLVKEFKEFAMRGNVVDLAVGVIMGAAFGKIVSSMVSDVLMPPIGYLVGGVKFTDLKVTLKKVTIKVPDPEHPGGFVDQTLDAVSLNYGNFLQAVFDFMIIAVCVFAMVKLMNTMMRKSEQQPPVPAPPTAEVVLLTEIRDLLKSKSSQ